MRTQASTTAPLRESKNSMVRASSVPLRVLLPVHSNTFFVELFRVARMLKRTGRYEPVLLFDWPYQTRLRDIRCCEDEGIAWLDPTGNETAASAKVQVQALANTSTATAFASLQPAASRLTLPRRIVRKAKSLLGRLRARLTHWAQRLRARLWGVFPSAVRALVGETPWYLRQHRKRMRFAKTVLEQQRIDLLVMAGDMVGYDTADFVKSAHDLEIPVVLVPSTMSNGLEQAEVYYHDANYHVRDFSSRLAARLFPRWVRKHRDRELLRRPAGDVFAMEWLGIAPPLPWAFNSGYADAIAAESPAMVRYYRACGIPEEQLCLTGSPANDLLAERLLRANHLREELYRQLGLPPARPMILTALPPDFLYLTRPECDFQNYDELVRFWMQTLASVPGFNIVVSLHPSVPPETMRHLETDSIKIGPVNTASLVPLCDLFVASVSSTIRWAIACGKPVINYDIYRYHYQDFLQVPGVLIVEEQQEFEQTLRRITQDRGFYEDVAARQQACASDWGVLDGKTHERIVMLFDSLVGDLKKALRFSSRIY